MVLFYISLGAVREYYTVETAVIRTTIGIKLNNSAKQIRAKEGGRGLDGGPGLDGGADGAVAKATNTASLGGQDKLDSVHL